MEFNSSAIIPAIIHIQKCILLTGQAWTERCSAGFSVSVETHFEQQEVVLGHCSWLCGSQKLVVHQEDWDLVRLEDILSGVSRFLFLPLASNGGITVLIVLPVHKLQYVNCQMLPQVFNLGMEWRYKTKIKYCYSYSTTLWKIVNNLYTSLLTGSLQWGTIIVNNIHTS